MDATVDALPGDFTMVLVVEALVESLRDATSDMFLGLCAKHVWKGVS